MECGVDTKHYSIYLCLWILHWCSGFLWQCTIGLWKLSEVTKTTALLTVYFALLRTWRWLITTAETCRTKQCKKYTLKIAELSKFYFIYSPTDAPVSCLKKILKFTLKQLQHVSVLQLHHHQGVYFVLTKVSY